MDRKARIGAVLGAFFAAALSSVASAASMGAYYELKRLAKEARAWPPLVGQPREVAGGTPKSDPAPELESRSSQARPAREATPAPSGLRFHVRLKPASPHLLSFVRVLPLDKPVVGSGETFVLRIWQKNNWAGGEYVLDLSCRIDPVEGAATARVSCSSKRASGKTYAGRAWESCGARLGGSPGAASDKAAETSATLTFGRDLSVETWCSASYDTWRSHPPSIDVQARLRLSAELAR